LGACVVLTDKKDKNALYFLNKPTSRGEIDWGGGDQKYNSPKKGGNW